MAPYTLRPETRQTLDIDYKRTKPCLLLLRGGAAAAVLASSHTSVLINHCIDRTAALDAHEGDHLSGMGMGHQGLETVRWGDSIK